jgi:hypothetical protein
MTGVAARRPAPPEPYAAPLRNRLSLDFARNPGRLDKLDTQKPVEGLAERASRPVSHSSHQTVLAVVSKVMVCG